MALDYLVDIIIVWLTFLYPMMAVIVRRLHDTGLSWWAVLTVLIPYVGFFALGWMLFGRGDDEENLFGPPPT